MKDLALREETLLTIEKPVRYIGGEVNSVEYEPDFLKKLRREDTIRFAMCFPDVYEIGMSHLGMKIIYDMMNRREDILCERVFSPWMDLDQEMRRDRIPLFALESQDPVFLFDFLAITIQYEMCYTNILQILDLSQIGIYARDRREDAPIVIGGGPCTYNPEPLADFFDIFYIGEGETVYYDLMDLYKEHKKSGGSRADFLHKAAATIPGIYVPSLYETTYHEDGTIDTFEPIYPDVPRTILKQVQVDLSHTFYQDKPLVPFLKVTQDRCVLEIQRGCTRGCRFCQAGMIYRPNRERDLDYLEKLASQANLADKWQEIATNEKAVMESLGECESYSELYRELEGFSFARLSGKHPETVDEEKIDIYKNLRDEIKSRIKDLKTKIISFSPSATIFVPHSRQNFALSGSSFPQVGHLIFFGTGVLSDCMLPPAAVPL